MRGITVISTVLFATGAATAQVSPEDLELVEQGVADITSLSTSLRQIDGGLQTPTGFDQLYSVPGAPGLHMRADGALFAVFPTSQYAEGQTSLTAQIPNNTVFIIGTPDAAALAAHYGLSVPLVGPAVFPGRIAFEIPSASIDGAVPISSARVSDLLVVEDSEDDLQGSAGGPDVAFDPPPRRWRLNRPLPDDVVTIATDAEYRAARLRELARVASGSPDA